MEDPSDFGEFQRVATAYKKQKIKKKGERKMPHFKGGLGEEWWKQVQEHLGYTDREMERLRKHPKWSKVIPAMGDPKVRNATMVIEVVKSHGCAEGMRVGDKLYFNGCAVLDPKRSSPWCAYALAYTSNYANLCHNLLLKGLDPNGMLFDHFVCMDCNSWQARGIGQIVMKCSVIDERKK